jgi:hypothetical protein
MPATIESHGLRHASSLPPALMRILANVCIANAHALAAKEAWGSAGDAVVWLTR